MCPHENYILRIKTLIELEEENDLTPYTVCKHTPCVYECVLDSPEIPIAGESYVCSKTERELDSKPDNPSTWRSNYWVAGICLILRQLFLFFLHFVCITPVLTNTHTDGCPFFRLSSCSVVFSCHADQQRSGLLEVTTTGKKEDRLHIHLVHLEEVKPSEMPVEAPTNQRLLTGATATHTYFHLHLQSLCLYPLFFSSSCLSVETLVFHHLQLTVFYRRPSSHWSWRVSACTVIVSYRNLHRLSVLFYVQGFFFSFFPLSVVGMLLFFHSCS